MEEVDVLAAAPVIIAAALSELAVALTLELPSNATLVATVRAPEIVLELAAPNINTEVAAEILALALLTLDPPASGTDVGAVRLKVEVELLAALPDTAEAAVIEFDEELVDEEDPLIWGTVMGVMSADELVDDAALVETRVAAVTSADAVLAELAVKEKACTVVKVQPVLFETLVESAPA